MILKTTDLYTKWVNCIVCELQLNLLLFSHQVMSDSLRPCGLEQARLPVLHCLLEFAQLMSMELVTPSDHLILCHPFSFCLQFFPASGSLAMSWLFAPGDQSTGASASVLPMNILGFVLDWLVWSPCSPGDSKKFSPAPQIETINSLFIHDYWKTTALTTQTSLSKVMSLLFNTLSRSVIAFLPRSKCLNFMAAVTVHRDLDPRKKSVTAFTFSLSICHEVM